MSDRCPIGIFVSKTLPTAMSRDTDLWLETTEGPSVLKMGVTFASFHIKSALPEVSEKLIRSLRGIERDGLVPLTHDW